MFNNIGGKIKVFVVVVTVLAIISCIVCGIAIIAFSVFGDNVMEPLSKIGLDKPVENLAGDFDGPFGILIGLVVMIAGSFAAWLIAFIPYGLGQLVQNTDKLVKGMDGIRNSLARNASNPAAPSHAAPAYANPSYPYTAYSNPAYDAPHAADQGYPVNNAYGTQKNPNAYADRPHVAKPSMDATIAAQRPANHPVNNMAAPARPAPAMPTANTVQAAKNPAPAKAPVNTTESKPPLTAEDILKSAVSSSAPAASERAPLNSSAASAPAPEIIKDAVDPTVSVNNDASHVMPDPNAFDTDNN